MKKLFIAAFSLIVVFLTARSGRAVEATWEYAVQVSATVQASPPQITLAWPQDTLGTPNSYTVYRKSPGAAAWGSGTTLAGATTSYADTSVAVGAAYEYKIVKAAASYTGYGYIQTGINVPLVESRGKVILVVDNTYAANLAAELTRLQQDLAGDGWTVLRHDVARNDSVVNIKNLIKADYNADPANVKTVFLFGHVPVPYSGQLNPDGHPDHVGAWPADAFYGDIDGAWTDSSVNFTQTVNTDIADAARLTNLPGDGKFDQTTIPSAVELQVGRVDLANMPGRLVWGGPATFPSEQELLRQYLNKDHNFRHRILSVRRKGVVGDYFGIRSGEAFAASAYRNFAPFFGAANIDNLNLMYNDTQGVWVPTLHTNNYLWAHGSGAGSYTSINGLGNAANYNGATTTEIVNNNIQAVFVTFFGSWLGDWDHEDDMMRGVLATKDYGLACAWSGRPHWFAHPMGLGETIGYTARLTQNNTGLYQNQVNSSPNLIHIALMGDPTLRLHPVAPPGSLGGTLAGSTANISWTPSSDSVSGYNVYRASSALGPFTRLNSSLVSGTTFADTSAPSGATYMVRAVKLETVPSGSYTNASQGLFWSNGGAPPPAGDTTAPTIALSAPANGATVSGSSVTVSATASDNVGVAGVQFKLDGANLGSEVTASPYLVTLDSTTVANGSHTLAAVARDAAGNQATANSITINVSNAAPPASLPTVTITSTDTIATEGTTDYAVFTLTRTGSTTGSLDVTLAPSGTATKWDDYRRPMEGDMPDTFTIPAGASSLTISVMAAADSLVEGTETAILTIQSSASYTVGTPNSVTLTLLDSTSAPPPADTTAPTASLTAPVNGATVSGPAVTVLASVSDNVGVAGVQFKFDGANLGAEITNTPFGLTFDSTYVANGSHTITAVARDAAGNQTTTAAISVTVSNSAPVTNPPPSTNITASALPSWVASTPTHNWKPRLGGVYWLNSLAVLKQAAPAIAPAQLSRPALVDIKANVTGFGYRFDLNSWDPHEESYGWFLWDGTDQGTPASPEDAMNIFGATGNAEFILNLPIPRTLTNSPPGDGYGYLWQTPEFYGAMVQYLYGTAGPQSEWQNLSTSLDFFSQPASFNWANLRARRGHVAPYSAVAIIIGEEPYNLEGLPDGASYGPQAEKFRVAIRNRGVNLPLGLHVRDMGIVDDPDPSKWFWPMMNSITESDFSFIDLEHYYQFSTVPEDFKRTFPVSVNPTGFQGWWMSKSQWKSDYTKFLWIVEDTRNALRDFGGAGVGDPNRWQLGFSEHGIQVASQFMYNDMFSAVHWAGWLAESMRQNITWDSGWTLIGEGFATADLQIRNGYVTRTPMYFAYQMAQEFYGMDYLTNSYTGAMGSGTDNQGRAIQFPLTTVRTFRDPVTGNIHLFVVNQSTNSSTTLTGFENWNVVSWKQLKGATLADNNPLGVPGPEPIQTVSATLPALGTSLIVPPISVNHIILSASGSIASVDTTPPVVAITAPLNGATVSGAALIVSATASDNVGVAGLQFKWDGVNLGGALTAAPYAVTVDTTTAINGAHTLSADAWDAAANHTTASVTVTVTNVVTPPPTLPTVTVAASDATATIGTTDYGTFTFTRTGNTSAALTVNYNLGGSAIKWTDYRRPVEGDMPVSITIPAGASSYTMTIAAMTNSTGANPLNVSLTLSLDAAYTVGSPNAATINLATVSAPVLPTVTVTASDATATIGTTDYGTFTFTRTGDTSAALTVNYNLGGTATKWTDYRRPVEGDMPVTITIPAGASSYTMTIAAIANSTGANPLNVSLTLSPDVAYTVGSSGSATIALLTPVVLPTVTVSATDASAARTNGDTGKFTITRTGSTAAALTVTFAFSGTATNGSDYTALATSVTIPAGAASATLTVAPKSSTKLVGAETAVLTIAANASYTVGSANSATVNIGGNTVPVTSVTKTGNSMKITWASVAGKTYRVAYKNNITDASWIDLSGTLTASGSLTSWTDTNAASKQRFYTVYMTN